MATCECCGERIIGLDVKMYTQSKETKSFVVSVLTIDIVKYKKLTQTILNHLENLMVITFAVNVFKMYIVL